MMVFAGSLSAPQNRAILQRSVPRLGLKRKLRKAPRPRYPAEAERELLRGMMPLVARLIEVQNNIVGESLEGIIAESRSSRPTADAAFIADAWSDRLARIMAQIRVGFAGAVAEADVERLARRIAKKVASLNEDEFHRVLRSVLKVDVMASEPWLAAEMEAFVGQATPTIAGLADEHLARLQKIVYNGAAKGLRHETIAAQIVGLGDISEKRVAFIARNEVSTFNGTMTQLRQTQTGISRYRWRGVLDQRERPEHVAREGQVFKWSEPPWDGHPGQPYNCRCTAEPLLDDLLGEDAT